MRSQWKSLVTIATLALCMGVAPAAWSQVPPPPPPGPSFLADPMAEDYGVHLIPFYKINENWAAFLVVADTSFQDLDEGGTPISLLFYNAACNLVADVIVTPTRADAQFFALHDPTDANGQFGGLAETAPEGVILLDAGLGGEPHRFLTYVLLVNGNENSLIRIDSIPCQGPQGGPCLRGAGTGRWLRYDTFNTVAATFGDSGLPGNPGTFQTSLYFFSARGDLRAELLRYGTPLHGEWATDIHVDAWCDEIYLGSRRLELDCTQRLRLTDLNYTFLTKFPNPECAGKPGHLETYASDNGLDVVAKDYSGFQETTVCSVAPINLIGTGYMHHSGFEQAPPVPGTPEGGECGGQVPCL
jgi:hypothetical protein